MADLGKIYGAGWFTEVAKELRTRIERGVLSPEAAAKAVALVIFAGELLGSDGQGLSGLGTVMTAARNFAERQAPVVLEKSAKKENPADQLRELKGLIRLVALIAIAGEGGQGVLRAHVTSLFERVQAILTSVQEPTDLKGLAAQVDLLRPVSYTHLTLPTTPYV